MEIILADGSVLPAVGLGLWKLDKARAPGLVEHAIRLGYRHLDSACDYGNETAVGAGIRAALNEGICRRDELWVTSKLWNTYHAAEHVRPALERSLRDLGLDYLDLYLVHFPIALRYVSPEQRYPPGWLAAPDDLRPRMESVRVPIIETWRAMERLVGDGLVRHIGVCNFNVSLIRDLLNAATLRPEVLQVESHPYLAQEKLLRFCREEHIAMTAFSPLGSLSYVSLGMATPSDTVLGQPAVLSASSRLGRTPAQVVLRWGIQRGTAVIPKTANLDRLGENLALDDFTLSNDEMASIGALDCHRRFNDPGVFCEAAFHTFFPIFE